MKIYLDSCILICLVERHPVYSLQIESLINSLAQADYFYSALSRMETLVMPLRTKDVTLHNLYELFFSTQTVLDIKNEIYDQAAKLRADFPTLKTPDAIHLATAIFITAMSFGRMTIG